MIEVHGVAEFMDDKATHQFWTEKQEIVIQADGSLTGTTPPPTFLAANLDFVVAQADLGTHLLQPGDEVHPALMLQPAFQEFLAPLDITRLTTDSKMGMVKVD